MHNLKALRDKTGDIPGYTRIFLVGVPDALKHLKNLKNEIGMNAGKKNAAAQMCSHEIFQISNQILPTETHHELLRAWQPQVDNLEAPERLQ